MEQLLQAMKAEEIEYLKMNIRQWLFETSFVEFYKEISKYVIGQPELKSLCYSIYTYLQSIAFDLKVNSNILLAGTSGTGKTETFRVLRDYFDRAGNPHIKVTIIDTTQISSPGFKGQNPVDVLRTHFENAGATAEYGIIVLDEFDKRLVPSYANGGGQSANVSHEVQNGLLKIIEGADINIPQQGVLNTEKLLFVGMGSFDYFRKKKANEVSAWKRTIGFNHKEEKEENETVNEWKEKAKDAYMPVSKTDIAKGGGIIELLGRFNTVINYAPIADEVLEQLIEKIRKDVEKSLLLTDIILERPMIELLKSEAKTEYGVRLVEENIRDAVMKNLVVYHMSDECNKKELDDVLVVTLSDKENGRVSVRKMNDEEYEYYEAYFDFEEIEDGVYGMIEGNSELSSG